MATVTVYTAARMKAIEDSSIVGGTVVGDDLILTRFDTSTVNAGNVRGPQGIQGPIGEVSQADLTSQLNAAISAAHADGAIAGSQLADGAVTTIKLSDGSVSTAKLLPIEVTSVSKTITGTLALTDAGKLIEVNSTSAVTLTVPENSVVPFPVGTQISIIRVNTGTVSFSPASGVTLNSRSGYRNLYAQWSGASLIKRASNSWVLLGDLSA